MNGGRNNRTEKYSHCDTCGHFLKLPKRFPRQVFLPAQRKLMRCMSSSLYIMLSLITCTFVHHFQGQLLLPKDFLILKRLIMLIQLHSPLNWKHIGQSENEILAITKNNNYNNKKLTHKNTTSAKQFLKVCLVQKRSEFMELSWPP